MCSAGQRTFWYMCVNEHEGFTCFVIGGFFILGNGIG